MIVTLPNAERLAIFRVPGTSQYGVDGRYSLVLVVLQTMLPQNIRRTLYDFWCSFPFPQLLLQII